MCFYVCLCVWFNADCLCCILARPFVRSFARSVLAYELSTHGTERGENGIYVEFSQDVPFIPFFLALALILALTRRLIFPESLFLPLPYTRFLSRPIEIVKHYACIHPIWQTVCGVW